MKSPIRFWLLNIIIFTLVAIAHRIGIISGDAVMATVVGASLDFGVASDEESLTTQKVEMTNKSDITEARDHDGDIISVSFYNYTQDISIEGLGSTTLGPGNSLSMTSPPMSLVGTAHVLEAGVTTANTEFVKSTIKARTWAQI